MKLIEMYSTNANNPKMTRGKNQRNAKENHFGGGPRCHNHANFDMLNSENIMRTENRFPMNYFHDIDQSCVDQLKEYLKTRRSGK
jgi:hypothetical protein